MYFTFKHQPSDFVVNEVLPFKLNGNGDFFYVFFEKERLNTMDILMRICQTTGLKREQIGIAGLKDKEGITKQWLSISRKHLKICGGVSEFSQLLREKVKILST